MPRFSRKLERVAAFPRPAMTIDGPSWLLGMASALPVYWLLDNVVVPRFAHLLAVVARNRERV